MVFASNHFEISGKRHMAEIYADDQMKRVLEIQNFQ